MRQALAALTAAVGLAGCASLNEHPEYRDFTEIGKVDAAGSIAGELKRVAGVGNAYRQAGKNLNDEASIAGAGIIGSGFYGAVVTAFNPAPKNLLAALLGAGSAQAWRTGLKPSERAKVYIKAYRGMDCLYSVGSGLEQSGADNAALAAALRGEIDGVLAPAEQVRQRAVEDGKVENNEAALLARFETANKALTELDGALRVEENVLSEAPNRIGGVRRRIEDDTERVLTGLAPDYSAALKLIADSVKPASTTPPATPSLATPEGAPGIVRPPSSLAATVALLEATSSSLKRRAPTLAATAYENMTRCVAASS